MNALRACLLSAALLALPACTPTYRKVVLTDARGGLVASYVAKGRVIRDRSIHRFVAVERTIPNPPRTYRYPLGHLMRVAAAEIVIYPVEEPEWLRGLTPLDAADQAEGNVVPSLAQPAPR